jgi:hypothetical protein
MKKVLVVTGLIVSLLQGAAFAADENDFYKAAAEGGDNQYHLVLDDADPLHPSDACGDHADQAACAGDSACGWYQNFCASSDSATPPRTPDAKD